jgi:hypothetical protein
MKTRRYVGELLKKFFFINSLNFNLWLVLASSWRCYKRT